MKNYITWIAGSIVLAGLAHSAFGEEHNPTGTGQDYCQQVHGPSGSLYCEGGSMLYGMHYCHLLGIDNVSGIGTPSGNCDTIYSTFYCENGEGTWTDDPKGGGYNIYCAYPKYKFRIINQTAFTLDHYYFDATYTGDNPEPDPQKIPVIYFPRVNPRGG